MFYLDQQNNRPIYEQLYEQITSEILAGKLAAGVRLPATRTLAQDLKISRNTVSRAYSQLLSEGFVSARIGSGYYVNTVEAAMRPLPQIPPAPAVPPTPMPCRYSFSYGSASNDVFLHGAWKKSVSNALTQLYSFNRIEYPSRPGEWILRKEIASYLQVSRGVNCTPEQVIITCGHQQSMELLANMFAHSAKRFAMEEPGYDGIRVVFENHGYTLLPIPVEPDGISVSALSDKQADLLYLTPSHQFPMGMVLSIAKRLALIHWAEETGCYLIEDDYDSELRYYQSPIPSLQSLDSRGRVIYTGTFAKCLLPTLRTAYIVFPPELLNRYYARYVRYNAQVSVLIQYAIADFMASGNFQKQIARLRTYYRGQQKALVDALYAVFGNQVDLYGVGAGLHILVDFHASACTDELIASARKASIGLYSPRVHFIHPENCPRSMLLIGFATIPAASFEKILLLLKERWQQDGLF